MWSGWGIRTLSSDHVAYNPFSYHTGTVWPHDNAMIAGGFRRYGFDAEAARVAKGMFDAAERQVAYRLPELFAGLPRHEASFPVQYLGANVPAGVGGRIDLPVHRDPRRDPHDVRPQGLADLRQPGAAGRGCRSSRSATCGPAAARSTSPSSDGSVDVLSNTTGFEVIHAPAPRPETNERGGR